MNKKKKGYYDIRTDMKKYPDAWLYDILSPRGPGKTYSVLRRQIEEEELFIFIKRTKKDVNMITGHPDFNPFKALNRDLGWQITPHRFEDGIGVFRDEDENVKGYVFSLANVSDVKGFELSECDSMIFDEYVPLAGSRVYRNEGFALLDFYDTIKRDRRKRGKGELRLILLGNPTNLTCPINRTLYLTNALEEMQRTGKEYIYLEDSRVCIHKLNKEDYYMSEGEEEEGINVLMKGSAWYETNRNGNFGYNDFHKVTPKSLKGYKPLFRLICDRDKYIVYRKNGYYYCTSSDTTEDIPEYNFAIETDRDRFKDNIYYPYRQLIVDGRMSFQTYAAYDQFYHFKDNYKI